MAKNSLGWHKGIYLAPLWLRATFFYPLSAGALWYVMDSSVARHDLPLSIAIAAAYVAICELSIAFYRMHNGYNYYQSLFGMPPRNEYADLMKTKELYKKSKKTGNLDQREEELLKELEELRRLKGE